MLRNRRKDLVVRAAPAGITVCRCGFAFELLGRGHPRLGGTADNFHLRGPALGTWLSRSQGQ